MGWKITFDGEPRELSDEDVIDPFVSRWEGGKVVELDDLSPDLYDRISSEEQADGGTDSWWGVYNFPCASAGRMFALVEAAAEFAGVECPSKPSSMREAGLMVRLFERTQDISAKPVVNGFPQTPTGPEIGSSSGPQDDSVGVPPKSEANESLTS